VPPRSPH